ncbi:MAG: hypothetical protein HY703_01210 [Gemmatimonadetes bacterium]|nr:hypothetical protein [Gemmatimonadota bacterium]
MARRKQERSAFDRARDELFSHIHRCDVIGATEAQQREWMADTLQFMAERYPSLTAPELEQLSVLGLRFCKPVIPHGSQDTAPSSEDANAA